MRIFLFVRPRFGFWRGEIVFGIERIRMEQYLMKKISFNLAVIVLALASVVRADTSTLDETKTRVALPLPKPPVIDGFIDLAGGESWVWAGGAANQNWRVQYDDTLDDLYRGGEHNEGGMEEPWEKDDLEYDIYVGYDADNLYVAVRVTDDYLESDSASAESEDEMTWWDDSVEVFVDGDNSNFPERNVNDPAVIGAGGQYVITINNAFRDQEAGNPGYGENEAWFALTQENDDGYDAEFRISMDEIGNPQPGDIIGFTVAVNDDDDGGEAERQIIWVGRTHNEITYGNLILGGRSYTAPKTASAPTIDGQVNDDEYAGAEAVVVNRFTGIYNIPSGDDNWEEGDHEFTYQVVHDQDAVYVGVKVIDDEIVHDSAEADSEDGQTWHDDSIEIFFDPDDSNDSGRGGKNYEGQYVMTANGARRDNEANNPTFGQQDDWFAVARKTADGYSVEFKVSKSALLDPEDGTMMGFNVALNDDDGANRKAQLNWSGRPHSEFTYGHLTLAGEPEPLTPPSLNLKRNDDGSLTVEFEGTLQVSTSISGPWTNVPLSSPITVNPSNPQDPLFLLIPDARQMLYARSVR